MNCPMIVPSLFDYFDRAKYPTWLWLLLVVTLSSWCVFSSSPVPRDIMYSNSFDHPGVSPSILPPPTPLVSPSLKLSHQLTIWLVFQLFSVFFVWLLQKKRKQDPGPLIEVIFMFVPSQTLPSSSLLYSGSLSQHQAEAPPHLRGRSSVQSTGKPWQRAHMQKRGTRKKRAQSIEGNTEIPNVFDVICKSFWFPSVEAE